MQASCEGLIVGSEPYDARSSPTWRLALTYMQGKRGQRRVWALATDSAAAGGNGGVAYFAVPPLGSPDLSPGPAGSGSWRAASRELGVGVSPPPVASVVPLEAVVSWWSAGGRRDHQDKGVDNDVPAPNGPMRGRLAVGAAHALLRCGAWRAAQELLRQFLEAEAPRAGHDRRPETETGASMGQKHSDVGAALALLGEIAVQFEWDLASAAASFEAARASCSPLGGASSSFRDAACEARPAALLALAAAAGG
jgi:hypothetical protein